MCEVSYGFVIWDIMGIVEYPISPPWVWEAFPKCSTCLLGSEILWLYIEHLKNKLSHYNSNTVNVICIGVLNYTAQYFSYISADILEVGTGSIVLDPIADNDINFSASATKIYNNSYFEINF